MSCYYVFTIHEHGLLVLYENGHFLNLLSLCLGYVLDFHF